MYNYSNHLYPLMSRERDSQLCPKIQILIVLTKTYRLYVNESLFFLA
jgi:hypothetical protein